MRVSLACASAVLVTLAVAASAQAVVVSMPYAGDVEALATPGERNVLTVTIVPDGTAVVVADAAVPPVAGTGCEAPWHGTVVCRTSPGYLFVRVELGDGDDVATARVSGVDPSDGTLSFDAGEGDDRIEADGPAFLDGGAGDDRLIGGHALVGGPGDDVLAARGARADLYGGPGRDRLTGTRGDDRFLDADGEVPAADRYDGRGGTDVVDYNELRRPLRVDLASGTARTGGVIDLLRGVENADGGRRRNTLRGDAGPNVLTGHNRADRLMGRGGADRLEAYSGADVLFGGRGGDRLDGFAGGDRLDGGPGPDVVRGREGDDRLSVGRGDVALPGPGPDRVDAVGGRIRSSGDWRRDHIRCSPATGRIRAEVGDHVDSRCATVSREPVRSLLGDRGTDEPARVWVGSGRMWLEINCPFAEFTCTGTYAVRHAGRRIGSRRFRPWRTPPLPAPAALERALAAGRTSHVEVVVRLSGPRALPARTTAIVLASEG